jgi:hypothetical protein
MCLEDLSVADDRVDGEMMKESAGLANCRMINARTRDVLVMIRSRWKLKDLSFVGIMRRGVGVWIVSSTYRWRRIGKALFFVCATTSGCCRE